MKLQDLDFRIYHKKIGYAKEPFYVLYQFSCNIELPEILQTHCFNEMELELFTGFRDKNNKKIYEGDIVKIENSVSIGVIEFSLGIGSCVRYCSKLTSLGALQPYIEKIIGNIHENPELLEIVK